MHTTLATAALATAVLFGAGGAQAPSALLGSNPIEGAIDVHVHAGGSR